MLRFRNCSFLVSVVLSLALLAGCGGGGETEPTVSTDSQLPTVAITAPVNQTLLQAGQAVQVEVVASDDQAVSRIEFYVDNSLVESRVKPEGSALNTVREVFNWSAAIVGAHTLQARAYDAAGQMGTSLVVAVEVQSPGAPTAPPEDVASPVPQPTDLPTAMPEPTATQVPESPMVTAATDANVRGGPGTNYNVVGALKEGESATVTGRNADSSWWQIAFQGGTAWIANVVVTANAQAATVPVASAPPPPATNTPVPPTATPQPTNTSAPTTGLWADATALSAGQCTTLHWNFTGIKALYISFGYGYDKEPVTGTGSRQVCPSVTTTFDTTVVKPDNSQEHPNLTISVSGGGCGDPRIDRFVSTLPNDEVNPNTPFSVFWDVECAKAVWVLQVGGSETPVGGHGQKEFTLTSDTTLQLKVEKNSGGFVYASFFVNVLGN